MYKLAYIDLGVAMKLKLFSIVLVLALTSCVTPDRAAIGPYPRDFKQIISKHIRETFYDPYSIRDAEITFPREGHLFFKQGWIVCTKLNAKNRYGGYVGLTTTAYLIHNNQVFNSMENATMCSELNFTKWELSALQ